MIVSPWRAEKLSSDRAGASASMPKRLFLDEKGMPHPGDLSQQCAKQRAGVRPVLMIIPVQQNEKGPLFHGSNMLVLGYVGSGGE